MQILWSSPKASISTDRHSRKKVSLKKWTKVQIGYVLFLDFFPSLIIFNIFLTARNGKYLDQPRALQLCIPLNQFLLHSSSKRKNNLDHIFQMFFQDIWTPGLWTPVYLAWNIRCNLQLVADTELQGWGCLRFSFHCLSIHLCSNYYMQ